MQPSFDRIDWTTFTGRSAPSLGADARAAVQGRSLLITGAAGSIGSALAQTLGSLAPHRLVLLDQAEEGLARLAAPLHAAGCDARLVLGDLRNPALLEEVFVQNRIGAVFHAAACKHVPLLETNPFTAISVNTLGTHTLLEAASRARVQDFVHVSTDKAADPASLLGVSKRLAELLALTAPGLRVQVVRLGNVLGSTGSLGTVLWAQMTSGLALTLTDPAATRFFITLDEVVFYLLQALGRASHSALWVPGTMGAARPVIDLLGFLQQQFGSGASHPVRRTGLRPGDKLTEQLLGAAERYDAAPADASLRRVHTPLPERLALLDAVRRLEAAVAVRDLPQLLAILRTTVPSYRPGPTLAAAAPQCVAGASA